MVYGLFFFFICSLHAVIRRGATNGPWYHESSRPLYELDCTSCTPLWLCPLLGRSA